MIAMHGIPKATPWLFGALTTLCFLFALALPPANAGTCIFNGDRCVNSTYDTFTQLPPGSGYQDTQNACLQAGGDTYVSTGDIFTIEACQPGCCCGGANPLIKQIAYTCAAGTTLTTQLANDPTCQATCAAFQPPSNACGEGPVGTAEDGCLCGNTPASAGLYCCWNDQIVDPGQGQTCAPQPTTCPVNAPIGSIFGNSPCLCGGVSITSGVCCSSGRQAADVTQCSVTPPSGSVCGNNVKEGTEGCDGYYLNGVFQSPASEACANPSDRCTASCTCVPSIPPSSCPNAICEAGETSTSCPADCPAYPSCSVGSTNTIPQNPAAVFDATNPAAPTVTVTWSHPNAPSCTRAGYEIRRSTSSATAAATSGVVVAAGLPSSATSFVDANLPSNSTILYYAIVVYFDLGSSVVSQYTTVSTRVAGGDCPIADISYCQSADVAVNCRSFSTSPAQGGSKIICSPGEVCRVTTQNGGQQLATCYSASKECDKCNGLFACFVDDSQSIQEGGPGSFVLCSNSNTCYRDIANTSVELYLSCTGIDSCVQYRTQDACSTNRCTKPGGCTWLPLDQNTERGLCKPTTPAFQDCRACNALGASCTQDVCENIASSCYYHQDWAQQPYRLNASADTTGCYDKTEVPCEYFATQSACEGGTPFSLDVTYDQSGLRTGNTNVVQQASSDLSGHGKCSWLPDPSYVNGGSCHKDSDDNGKGDQYEIADQTKLDTYLLDFTDPTTSVYGLPNALYPADFRVNFSSTGTVLISFCPANQPAAGCYPQSTQNIVGATIRRVFGITESGDWILRYYAEETARNIEVVGQFPFKVDTQKPVISLVQKNLTIVRVGQNLFATDVYLRFTVNELSTCTTKLIDDASGNAIRASAQLVNAYGQDFALNYTSLADGSYSFTVTCVDTAQNPSDPFIVPLVADTDLTITAPSPHNRSNPMRNTSVAIAVNTSVAGNCSYGAVGSGYATMTPFSSTGGTRHTATLSGSLISQSKQYFFQVACLLNGTVVYGSSPQDNIEFAIDTLSPRPIVCDALTSNIGTGQCGPLNQNKAENFSIALLCQDEPSGTINFGCDDTKTMICAHNASDPPCQLAPGYTTGLLTGTQDTIIRYQMTDKGGNVGSVGTTTVHTADLTPPSYANFSITP